MWQHLGTIAGDNALIICGGKIFGGLIFVVEGTHENFNTLKISAYTVMWMSVGFGYILCILGISISNLWIYYIYCTYTYMYCICANWYTHIYILLTECESGPPQSISGKLWSWHGCLCGLPLSTAAGSTLSSHRPLLHLLPPGHHQRRDGYNGVQRSSAGWSGTGWLMLYCTRVYSVHLQYTVLVHVCLESCRQVVDRSWMVFLVCCYYH